MARQTMAFAALHSVVENHVPYDSVTIPYSHFFHSVLKFI